MKIESLTREQLEEVARHYETMVQTAHTLREDCKRKDLLLREALGEIRALKERTALADKVSKAERDAEVVIYLGPASEVGEHGVEVATKWRQPPVWGKPKTTVQAAAMEMINVLNSHSEIHNVHSDVPVPFLKPRLVKPQEPPQDSL
jgi:hypothetical protein